MATRTTSATAAEGSAEKSVDTGAVAVARRTRPGAGDLTWPERPLGGVTELRVHGVGGTPAAAMLDVAEPVQVSGDATAGMWRAPDRTDGGVTRHVEAYSWGGLTGRGIASALWLLTLPFALVNLAGWMAPSRHSGVYRALVRLAGLCVTLLYVLFAATASMDFAAYQCAGVRTDSTPGVRCAASSWVLVGEGRIAHDPARRIVVGAVVPLLVIVALWIVTWRTHRAYELWQAGEPRRAPSAAGAGDNHPGDEPRGAAERLACDYHISRGLEQPEFWEGRAYATRLAQFHVGVSLSAVAVLIAGGAATVAHSGTGRVLAWVALVTMGIGALAACLTRMRERAPNWLAPGFGAALVAVAVWVAWTSSTPTPSAPAGTSVSDTHPGTSLPWLPVLFDVVNLVLLAAALATLGVAYFGQGREPSAAAPSWATRVRRAVTPYTVIVLAAVLTLTVQSGAVLWFARSIGDAGVLSKDRHTPVAIEYGEPYVVLARALPWALLVIPATALVVWGSMALRLRWGCLMLARRRRASRLARDDADAAQRLVAAWTDLDPPRAWADASRQSRFGADVVRARRLPRMVLTTGLWSAWTVAVGISAAVVAYTTAWVMQMHRDGWPDGHVLVPHADFRSLPLSWCTWLLTAAPVGAVLLLRQTLTKPSVRRHTAIAWDVATFWPRSFHPLAPPSYAERAVPELQTRIRRLFEGDETSRGAVLLLGHSQGSVLVTAAVASLVVDGDPRDTRPLHDRLSLLTYGCPVTRLYAANFPAFFGDEVLALVGGKLRFPDAAPADPADGTLPADGTPPAAEPVLDGTTTRPGWWNGWRDTDLVAAGPVGPADGRVSHLLADEYLPDPAIPFHAVDDAPPRVRGHAEREYRRQTGFTRRVLAEARRLQERVARP